MRALGPHRPSGDGSRRFAHRRPPQRRLDHPTRPRRARSRSEPRGCQQNGSRRDMALHLQSTSGTTGTSKLAIVTHGNAIANCVGQAARMQMRDRDIDGLVVAAVPRHGSRHDGRPYLSSPEPTSVLMSPFDFLSDPTTYLRVISTERRDISTMPNFGFELATRRSREDRLGGVDLSAWRTRSVAPSPSTCACSRRSSIDSRRMDSVERRSNPATGSRKRRWW